MGRSRRAEDIALPLVSIGAPIPGLAYAPLFLLWFGLGNISAVLLVAFVSAFPIIFNTWTGVKAVKEIWVRSAQAMGADDRRLFRQRHPARRAALHPHRLAARPGAGVAHPGRRRNAGRGAVGPRLDDLRRARIPQHRRDAGRRRRDRRSSASRWKSSCSRRSRNYTVVRWGMMTMTDDLPRTATARRSCARPSTIAASALRAVRSGRAHRLFPAGADADAAEGRGATLVARCSTAPCSRTRRARSTACWSASRSPSSVGLPLGILMARFKPVEHFFMPLVSALMPIPSLAWVPVFILWFGLGNTVAILIVFYAATVPDAAQHLVGRARGQSALAARRRRDGRDENALFWKVIMPGASPFIITGVRQAFLRAWIAVIGAEIARGVRLGPRLGDLRRQGIPQRRPDARLAGRDRRHRLRVRAAGVRLDREGHRAALGHGARVAQR